MSRKHSQYIAFRLLRNASIQAAPRRSARF